MLQKRILFISNLYPTTHTPNAATFSRQQISALKNLVDIDVIAPIPWPTRLRTSIPRRNSNNGIDVYHPTYLYSPKIFRKFFGYFYYASIRNVAEKLLLSKKYMCIYSSWLFPDAWAAVQLSEKFKLPLVVNVVGTDVNRLQAGAAVTDKSLYVIKKASRVIAVSNKLKEHLVELGADSNKIDVVYNGVDRTVFRPINRRQVRDKLGIPEGRIVVLFVGNLKKEKGVLELTQAFARLLQRRNDMDLELILVGSGPFEREIRQSLKNNGVLEYARFLGCISQDKVAQWMNASNLLCLPSYMEGQPNVVIEALACQVRIVATNVGGIPELDRGQGNLLLIEPRSVTQLEHALDEMLSRRIRPAESCFISSWQENASRVFEIFENTSVKAS